MIKPCGDRGDRNMTVLKNGPHGIHAEPRDLTVEGSPGLPQRHDEGAKSLPVAAKYGGGLHRVEPTAEVQTTPTGIKTGVSRDVRADDNSVLTHRLSAGSNIGRRNRAVRERAEGRIWQAGKHYPFECSPSDVDDSAARDGPGLKLFSHPAQCANQFFPARISVVQI